MEIDMELTSRLHFFEDIEGKSFLSPLVYLLPFLRKVFSAGVTLALGF